MKLESVDRNKILVTTSRRPTNRLRTFCRDFAYSIPNTVRINRGKMSLAALAEKALELNVDHVIIISRWKGGPGKIEFFDVKEGLSLVPPLVYIKGVKLRREFEAKAKKVEACAVTLFRQKDSELRRFTDYLSKFLKLPIVSAEALKEINAGKRKTVLCISRNFEGQIQFTFRLLPRLNEVGPRVRLSHLIWEVTRK